MLLDTYQDQAMEFRTESADEIYAVLNLSGEVGELLGLMAKARRDGPAPDYDANIKKELGDILWMVAAIASDQNYDLSDIAIENLNKLYSRKMRNVISGSGDNR